LSVNSAFRTIAQQYLLYRWYQNGQCGISLAAVPGNSNHETGIAVDVGNYASVIGTLAGHGWSHSYPSSDPVHFDYTAGGTIDLRAESVLAFQKLWNQNNPGDKIAEDGDYGPMTAARIAKAPTTGFAKGSTCAPTTPPSETPSSKFAAQLMAQSPPPEMLLAGQTATVWVEFKNTGTETWTPEATFLGTADPHDRASGLAAPDWVAQNRASGVDAPTKPGEIGRFTFTVRGPAVAQATALTEQFELVEEGKAWFGPAATYTIDVEVEPSNGDSDGETGDPTATPGGGCDVGGHAAPTTGLAGALALVALSLLRRRRTARS
jgi:MYXO-CTERM domain-containing protein